MRKLILLSVLITAAAGCSAPQGKKLSSNTANDMFAPAPVASGPATSAVNLSMTDKDTFVNLKADGTVTVNLPANQAQGFGWRLAEVPDPSVLTMTSKESTPSTDPKVAGQQTFNFQASGPGTVLVKMWYGNLSTASLAGRTYEFTVAVNEKETPAPAAPTKKKNG